MNVVGRDEIVEVESLLSDPKACGLIDSSSLVAATQISLCLSEWEGRLTGKWHLCVLWMWVSVCVIDSVTYFVGVYVWKKQSGIWWPAGEVYVCVYMYLHQGGKCVWMCVFVFVLVWFCFCFSVCRRAQVSDWVTCQEHYTDTHIVALKVHIACIVQILQNYFQKCENNDWSKFKGNCFILTKWY